MKRLWGFCAAIVTVPLYAAEPTQFLTSAKVRVDDAGRVVEVEPDTRIPATFRETVITQALGLRFAPPQMHGAATSGVTYVLFAGCAVEAGEGMRMSLTYMRNGPQLIGGPWLPPPRYPFDMANAGKEASAKVIYAVEADGRATVERIDYTEITGTKTPFNSSIRNWIASLRYRPEYLAGQPVRTRLQTEVVFSLGGFSRLKRNSLHRVHDSADCLAVQSTESGDEMPVALDSPLKPVPAG